MTDKLLEQVSALADDELNPREADLLFARMERDGELRDAWERYHLIGETMRGAIARPHVANVASRVAAALEDDDAPAASRTVAARRLLRPAAGVAVAASVAMLAVFTLKVPPDYSSADVVPDSGKAPVATPLVRAQAVDFSGVRSPELQNQLRGYLLNHSEHSGSPRIRGVMPYVQIAAHDTRAIRTADDAATPDPKD